MLPLWNRRVTTRYEKTARNFLSFWNFAAILNLMKSLSTQPKNPKPGLFTTEKTEIMERDWFR